MDEIREDMDVIPHRDTGLSEALAFIESEMEGDLQLSNVVPNPVL